MPLRVSLLLTTIVFFSTRSLAQTIATYAGPPLPVSGSVATTQAIDDPHGVASDRAGGFYVSSYAQNRVYHVTASGTLVLIAGAGSAGYSGDGGPATAAHLGAPEGVAVDVSGNLFIADSYNQRIRKVTPAGIISTVAGDGTPGFSGDGGPATAAQLGTPKGVAVDASGNLFIADSYNQRVRKVTPAGMIFTVAGEGTGGVGGDGGPATAAHVSPNAVAVDASGNLFIADSSDRIRKVTPAGTISTVAGYGYGFSGDGGPATAAQMGDPEGVAVDASGNLFIADSGNGRIRKVTPDGIISTVAGNGI